MSGWRRVQRWYGFGPERAEVVLRIKPLWMFVLYPLLPVLLYLRIELRDGTIRAFGAPLVRGPQQVSSHLPLSLERPLGVWRVLYIGARHDRSTVRLSPAVWTRWRTLLDAIDPEHRLARNQTDLVAFDRANPA